MFLCHIINISLSFIALMKLKIKINIRISEMTERKPDLKNRGS